MSNKDENFQDNLVKLRKLRKDLCEQHALSKESNRVQKLLIHELKDMHDRLCKAEEAPLWCREKVEFILTEILALPKTKKEK